MPMIASSDELRTLLDRIANGTHTQDDILVLRRGLVTSGDSNVIQVGKYNVIISEGQQIEIGDRIAYQGADAETIQSVLREVLQGIASDRYDRSLQDYFRALRAYCANHPYLSLEHLIGRQPRALHDIYVQLRVRALFNSGEEGEMDATKVLERLAFARESLATLVLGEPGAGKSTFFVQIARNAWDSPKAIGLDRPYLPMVVPLASLALARGASVETRLSNALHLAAELTMEQDPPNGFLAEWPRRLGARWLFLLDGLDEVPEDQHHTLVRWLKDMLAYAKVEDHHVILSSRPLSDEDLSSLSQEFAIYRILPLAKDQQRELARRWFACGAEAFLQELDRMHLDKSSITPLALGVAATVFDVKGSLPEREKNIDFYETFVAICLNEALRRGMRSELGDDLQAILRPGLERIALIAVSTTSGPDVDPLGSWFCDHSFSIDEVGRLMGDYLRHGLGATTMQAEFMALRFVEIVSRRCGLLVRHGTRCKWLHRNFAYYLAACSLNRELDTGGDFDTLIAKLDWVAQIDVVGKLAKMSSHPKVQVRLSRSIISLGVVLALAIGKYRELAGIGDEEGEEEGGGGGGHH